ncbi:transcriptional regulator MraZ [Clostridia bacterium]|nr:transcriptional regulator MraZ [Clostridia bacterium]
MLFGEYSHTVDDKGRFRLPPKFKAELGESFVLTKGTDGSLFVFSAGEFTAHFQDKLRDLSIADKEAHKPLRQLFSSAFEAETDNQGRALLPANLKEYAGIGKNIAIIGMGTRAEIWSAERWAEYNKGADFDTAITALKDYKL